MLNKLVRPSIHLFKLPCVRLFSGIPNYSVLYEEKEPITVSNQYDILEDIAIPLFRVSYTKQLQIKQQQIENVVKKIMLNVGNHTRKDLIIFPIIPSPVQEYYRSKDEFSVRMGVDGDEKTFGCFSGKPDKEKVYSIRPIHLPIIKPEHLKILKVFEDFVHKSPLPPCYDLHDGGYWRRIHIKSNLKNDLMVVVVVHPQNRPTEKLEEERKQLINHFLSNDCQVQSFYHQLCTHVRCVKANSTLSLIHGEPYIYEEVSGYKFRISPDSFFQINVKAAEVLFEEICKIANFRNTTTLLDLGCGVGAYSILYSQYVRSCIGIDCNISSIEDAIANAELNGVTNCDFIPGNIETRLTSVFDMLNNVSDITVIMNPGRGGVHKRVIYLLRQNTTVNKILYVTCKLDNRNVRENICHLLQEEKKYKTKPFKLKILKSVDLFPHTYHYEMILYFER